MVALDVTFEGDAGEEEGDGVGVCKPLRLSPGKVGDAVGDGDVALPEPPPIIGVDAPPEAPPLLPGAGALLDGELVVPLRAGVGVGVGVGVIDPPAPPPMTGVDAPPAAPPAEELAVVVAL